MENRLSAPVPVPDAIHAETKLRDPAFIMNGHHCHTCFELFYVENGDCRFLINDHIHDLHAGDFILIPPMVLHYTRYVFGPCRRTVLLFQQSDVSEATRQCMPSTFFEETNIFQAPIAYREQLSGCLKRILAEEKVNDATSVPLRQVLLQELLLLCSRVCYWLSEPPVNIHTTDQEILHAARYISEHYMQPITTEDVAQAVGFSPNHLSRKFRQSAGVGLHEYLVFIRLDHAASELISTGDSITTIALRCGFSTSNYFKDTFKKKYGVTPRQYRKMM